MIDSWDNYECEGQMTIFDYQENKLTNIDDHLKSCREDANVYTFSFTREEVNTINEALNKKAWIDEVRELLKEQTMTVTIEEFYNRLRRNKSAMNTANYPWDYVEVAYREMKGIV